MNNDTLVSLNIFNNENNQLINKIPILYYWNGDGDLLDSIINNKTFLEKYLNNISYNLYNSLYLGYFFFEFDKDNNEIYKDNIIKISDYIDLDKFNSKNIINEIIIKHLYNLYKISMKDDYKDVKVFNEDIILDIYSKIKDKYKEKLNKETFINWIRQELINKNKINNNNSNYIIDYLKNVLINKD